MEVLNNIWTALTTENEIALKITTYPLTFIEGYLTFKLFTSVLNIQYTKRQKFIYIILASLLSLISISFIPSPYNLFVNYICTFILTFLLFKLTILKTFIAIILPQLLFTLIGTLIMGPLLKIFNITYNELALIPIYRVTYLLISYTIFFSITFLLNFKNIAIRFIEELDNHNKRIFILNLILGFATLIFEIVLLYNYINVFSLLITTISFILLLSYFGISFYSLTRVMKLQLTTRDLENAEAYNETLQILYDNVKSFKHDFDNMNHMVDGYLKNDDLEGLKKYYYDLTKDYDRVNNISILNPNIINNPGIYNMLISKYKVANNVNVKLHIEFFMDFNTLHMPIYEFSRILGILIDNAIEAASECDKKEVNIMFRSSYKDNVEIVKIENTYKNKDVDLSKIFTKEVSSKNNHMGMGLWEVNQIINRFNHIKIVPSKDDKYFSQQLEIYY